jgi:hypothetical protein
MGTGDFYENIETTEHYTWATDKGVASSSQLSSKVL